MAKLLTVFGATGQQGGALIEYILENSELSTLFRLRGVTRDMTKPKAVKLNERGVEMLQANLNEPPSLEGAVANSHVVFAVTNHWEESSAAVEIAQGKAIAEACVGAGVIQIIWSSLPNVKVMTSGEIPGVEHFDSKAEVEEYIRTLDIKSMFFMPGWFMQNHLKMMRPQPLEDGTFIISMPGNPDSLFPLIDIRDAGKFIAPALFHPDLYHGKNFTCATAFYTPTEMAETWTKVTGKTVRSRPTEDGVEYITLSEEQKDASKKAKGLITKYFYFGPTGKGDLAWTLEQMTEKPKTWEDFVKEHKPWFVD